MTMATAERPRRPEPEQRRAVFARFRSKCGWCHHLISPVAEELVEQLPDGRHVHEDCADDYYAGVEQPPVPPADLPGRAVA